LGGRVFSDSNKSQPRLDALMLESRDANQRLLVDVGSNGSTVDEIVHGDLLGRDRAKAAIRPEQG
jgi:hypothetical protein